MTDVEFVVEAVHTVAARGVAMVAGLMRLGGLVTGDTVMDQNGMVIEIVGIELVHSDDDSVTLLVPKTLATRIHVGDVWRRG